MDLGADIRDVAAEDPSNTTLGTDGDQATRTGSTSSFDLTLRPMSREPLTAVVDTGTADLVQIRPIEWESLTSVGADEEQKEYQSDTEVQSIINQLADLIAVPDVDPTARKAGPAARSYGGLGVVSAVPEAEPVQLGELTLLDPEDLALQMRAGAGASAAPLAPDPPVETAVVETPVAETPVAEGPVVESPVVESPVVEPPVVEPPVAAQPEAAPEIEPDAPVEIAPAVDAAPELAPAAAPGPETATAAPVEEPAAVVPAAAALAAVDAPQVMPEVPAAAPVTGRVDIPVIAEATPVPTVSTPTIPTPAPETTVVPAVAATAISAPMLPKIEPKPGASRPTSPVDFNSLLGGDGPLPKVAVKRKRKRRNPLGGLLKLIVVVGIIGGAAYVGKVYFLDQRWPDDVGPIAEKVAEQRGLEWDKAVDVEVLSPGVYALRLAESMLGVTAADTAALSVEWRAMGLAEGSIDLAAIGSAALADQPAFYDPASKTIYVIDGLSEDLREIVLTRALGNALLDQHFGWGTTVANASGESVKLGVRALFDGDALALTGDMVATLLADPARAAAVTDELAVLRAEAASLARGASPYASAIVGRAGDPTRHLFSSQMTPSPLSRNGAEELAVSSDASVYDGVRSRTSTPEVLTSVVRPPTGAVLPDAPADPSASADPAAPADSVVGVQTAGPARMAGMIYWYYVLAGRLDPGTAWRAALAWNGDITEQALMPDGRCVSSTIATFDADGQQLLLGALQQWAALAPAESATTVAAGELNTVLVTSCDPGPTADTLSNTEITPFGYAEAELAVAGDLLSAGLPRSEAARNCVINAVRGFGVPNLVEPASVDPALAEPQLDLTSQAARDLMAGCGDA